MVNFYRHKHFTKYLKVLILGIIASAFLFAPLTVSAAVPITPREPVAATGRVLQASTCDTVHGLDVSISPATAAIGQKVTLTAQVKSFCRSAVASNAVFVLDIFNGPISAANTSIATIRGSGYQATSEILIAPAAYSVGDHLLAARMVYKDTDNNMYGDATFQVTAASTTGAATLSVTRDANPSVSAISGTVTMTFHALYSKGGSNIEATAIQYTCAVGEVDARTADGSLADIECNYDKTARSHTVTMQAMQSVNGALVAIPGATWTTNIQITGHESDDSILNTVVGAGKAAWSALGCISWLVGGPECTISLMISTISDVFGSVLKVGSLLLAVFMERILSIQTFTPKFAQVTFAGWVIFRNLGNIFFILAIVAIGVATVFRISGWAVKDLLVKLIIGAILINFSLTIAQAILGIADTVQHQFLPGASGVVREIINPFFSSSIWQSITVDGDFGTYQAAAKSIVNFWFMFAAFIAILGITFLLVVRLVMLWLLLMFSPLAYVAMVLPFTRKYSHMWWSKFLQWAFVTPIVAFMLNLTALVTRENSKVFDNLTTLDPSLQNSSLESTVSAMAVRLVPLVFMYMTIKVASSFGKGASGFVDKTLEKGLGATFLPAAATGALALSATKYGATRLNQFKQEKTLAAAEKGGIGAKAAHLILSPISTGKGIKAAFDASAADRKRRGEHAQDMSAEILSKSPLGALLGHKSLIGAVEARKAKEAKELMDKMVGYSQPQSLQGFEAAVKDKNSTAAEVEIMRHVQNRDLGTMLAAEGLGNTLAGKIEFLDRRVADGTFTEETAARLSGQIDSEAKKQGDLHYMGGTRVEGDKLVRITSADIATAGSAGADEFAKQQAKYAERLTDMGAGARARDASFGMVMREDGAVPVTDVDRFQYQQEYIERIANLSDADVNAADSVNDKRKRQELKALFDPVVGELRRQKAVDAIAVELAAEAAKEGVTLTAAAAGAEAQDKFNKYLRKYLQVTTSGQAINKKSRDLFTTLSRENANFGSSLKGIGSADRRRVEDYVNNLGTSPEDYTYNMRSDINTIFTSISPAQAAAAQAELQATVAKSVASRFSPVAFGITSPVTHTQLDTIRNGVATAIQRIVALPANAGVPLKNLQPALQRAVDAELNSMPPAATGLSAAEVAAVAAKISKV